jgi:hypothetical protein
MDASASGRVPTIQRCIRIYNGGHGASAFAHPTAPLSGRFAPPSVELQPERFDYRRPECNVGGKRLAEFFGI